MRLLCDTERSRFSNELKMSFSHKSLIFVFAAVIIFYGHTVNCANILVISFFSTKSNKITYLPLIERLGERGHNITIVSPVKPIKEMKNVKEIVTVDIDKILYDKDFDAFDMKEKGQTAFSSSVFTINYQVCNETYGMPEVLALLKEKFDLIFFMPAFNDCVLGLIYRLKAPLVLFTATSAPSFTVNKIGGHFPPSITPSTILGYPGEMNFIQRFFNFGVNMALEAFIKFNYEPNVEQLYREKLGSDVPSVNEILANASLILSNGHFSVSGTKPYFPDVIDVGGIHSRPAKPLPKDLQDFIDKGKQGFILFSLGSAIKGEMMPESKRKMLLNVFSKLKQQVLWKWESESMPNLPANVKLSKWLPQQDLLGHKEIKMFITHCGGGSTEEAIYHGVPLLGIPFIGDQPQNAKKAKAQGFLLELDWNELTEETFLRAIDEVLSNPNYRNNVKRLSALFRDRPQNPIDLGVYWVEYVLRHKGAPHLTNVGRKLYWFQYHSVDVITAYVCTIAFTLFIIYRLLAVFAKKIVSLLFPNYSSSTKAAMGKKEN